MARKNIFDITEIDEVARRAAVLSPEAMGRPLLGIERDIQVSSPVGAISKSLDNLNAKAAHVEEMEKQLVSGQLIVEIPTDRIDPSIVTDRLSTDGPADEQLAAQIRDNGQQVPILVRPHPKISGRFQVAYGHRRVQACRILGIPVRAIVRDLTDEQLVVSQGQENNSREDLSYIERCYFAYRLEGRGFGRDLIMTALGVDKAALSRMISLAAGIPAQILQTIGNAPSYGRVKWTELSELLERGQDRTDLAELLQSQELAVLSSDERFEAVHSLLATRIHKRQPETWIAPNGASLIKISATDRTLNLSFDRKADPGFGKFVQERLKLLYREYIEMKTQEP